MTEGIGRPVGDDRAGRVAYQGAPGAFSHEACTALRPWDQAIGFDTFAEAIDAVAKGDCDCALIPVENTVVGVVEPAASLVEASRLNAVSEVWRPIRMALMALPEARLGDIRTAESHPVALRQCAAAEIYGLSILRNDLQDSADNRTRFVLLSRQAA